MTPVIDQITRRFSSSRGDKASLVAHGMNARIIQSILDLQAERSPQHYYQKLTQLIALIMQADICLLMIPPKTGGQLIVLIGFNAITDKPIEGFTIDGRKTPTIREAIQKGNPLRLEGDSATSEVNTLAGELGLKPSAHLLEVPFKPKESGSQMGFLLLSSPPRAKWGESDAAQLMEIIKVFITNVPQPEEGAIQGNPIEEAEKYRQAYTQLKTQYSTINSQVRDLEANLANMTELEKSRADLQEAVNQLETRNRELESLVTKYRPSHDEAEQLREELRSALEDLARIPTTLSKSDQKMLQLQLSGIKQLDDMGPIELVTSIAQEFRQPLSSISGYTDLLLGESVGILGAMQRKFLERVKASVERLGTLINELVQVVAIEGGRVDQTKTNVDLKALIDEAIGNIRAQVSEKNVTLRLDVPENLPAIQANRDALQQILSNLLQNACLATPVNREMKLYARVESKDNEPHYLLLSVTDQGKGIPKSEISRIFLRHYKEDNPQIQGIGDTGVGLSIVKSLVELQKGRIWVDSKEGTGTTYSCILPLAAGAVAN